MRMTALALALTWTVLGLPGGAGADSVTDPSGVFAFDLPGRWEHTAPTHGVATWQRSDPQPNIVMTLGVQLEPGRPMADQLIEFARDPENEFNDARDFRRFPARIMGADTEVIAFVFTGEGFNLQVFATVVPGNGRQDVALLILGAEGTQELPLLVEGIIASIRRPGEAPPRTPEPRAGTVGPWRVADLPEGMGVHFAQPQQPGVVGQVRVLPQARDQASRLLPRELTSSLNARPEVETWGASADGRYAQCTFRVTLRDMAARGEAFLSVGPRDALLAVVYAPESHPSQSLAAARSFVQDLLRPSGGGGGPAIDPATVALTRTPNDDGSAWVSVPRGWQVSDAKGIVVAIGPEGSLIIGAYGQLMTPQAAAQTMALDGGATARTVGVSDYLPPPDAVTVIIPKIYSVGGIPVADVRILNAGPVTNAPGFAWAHCTFRRGTPGGEMQTTEGLAYVSSTPSPDGWWHFTITLLEAPQEQFARSLPLLMRIYETYGVSQALMDDRWKTIHQTQRETHEIIQQVIQRRSDATEVAAKQWDRYIRGTEPFISDRGEVRDLGGLGDLFRWAGDEPNLSIRPLTRDEWLRLLP